MVLSRRRVDVGAHEALSINNEQLEEVNSINFFGVQIDNKLNFKEHLAMFVKKNGQQKSTEIVQNDYKDYILWNRAKKK
jgi:hypothetical protein